MIDWNFPRRRDDREERWDGIRLQAFEDLQGLLRSNDGEILARLGELRTQLGSWSKSFESFPSYQAQLEDLRWLLRAAHRALDILSRDAGWDARVADPPPWFDDCVALLLGRDEALRTLDIPVVGVNSLQSDGVYLQLKLQLLRGTGEVFLDPRQLFGVVVSRDFEQGLQDAWRLAKKLTGKGEDLAVRWNLGPSPPKLSGRSASAAAFCGFQHLLAGTCPDRGVLILAEIDPGNNSVKAVGGVHAKIRTALQGEPGRFDTVVVRDDGSAAPNAQARQALKGQFPHVQVKTVVALSALLAVRSQLAEAVMSYLERVMEDSTVLPRYYPLRLRQKSKAFLRIRQRVRVVESETREILLERHAAEERERLRWAGRDIEHLTYAPRRSEVEVKIEDFHDDLEEDEQAWEPLPPSVMEWEEAARLFEGKAVVLLGDPGFGKTFLLRYWSHARAHQALMGLRSQTLDLESLELPVFCRLSDLQQDPARVDRTLANLCAEAIRSEFRPSFREYVTRRIEQGPCVLLLDAWDEVPDSVRSELAKTLARFAGSASQLKRSIVLTSRVVGYASAPVPFAHEVELLAFGTGETASFVREWFADDEVRQGRMVTMLQDHPTMAGLARIPLLLSLMCNTLERACGTSDFPTRRGELCERCLVGLLQVWKSEKEPGPTHHPSSVLRLLAWLAYDLTLKKYEQLDEGALLDWLGSVPPSRWPSVWHEVSPEEVVKQLQADGILVRTRAAPDSPLVFLHRTFQEYLAALFLGNSASEQGWESIREVIDTKAWDPDWSAIIVLLAGLLDASKRDVSNLSRQSYACALLELLSDERSDDVFRHRLALAGMCLSELSASSLQSVTAKRAAAELLAFWSEMAGEQALPAIGHLTRAVRGLPRQILWEWPNVKLWIGTLTGELDVDSQGSDVVWSGGESVVRPAGARCVMVLGDSVASPGMVSLLQDLIVNPRAEGSAFRAGMVLGALRGAFKCESDTVGALINATSQGSDYAAYALGQLGEVVGGIENVRRVLVCALRNGYPPLDWHAAAALGRLGNEAAEDPLVVQALLQKATSMSDTAQAAVMALGRLGRSSPDAVFKPMWQCHRAHPIVFPEVIAQPFVVRAFSLMGEAAAQDREFVMWGLKEFLYHPHSPSFAVLAATLARAGSPASILRRDGRVEDTVDMLLVRGLEYLRRCRGEPGREIDERLRLEEYLEVLPILGETAVGRSEFCHELLDGLLTHARRSGLSPRAWTHIGSLATLIAKDQGLLGLVEGVVADNKHPGEIRGRAAAIKILLRAGGTFRPFTLVDRVQKSIWEGDGAFANELAADLLLLEHTNPDWWKPAQLRTHLLSHLADLPFCDAADGWGALMAAGLRWLRLADGRMELLPVAELARHVSR